MIQPANRAIINISIGPHFAWHHRGRMKMLNSVYQFEGNDIAYISNIRQIIKLRSAYEDKLDFIKQARKFGYTRLLWLDCSVTAIKPLDDIWKWIDEKGYYLYWTGYNCAQSCNDASLAFYGITRDEAEGMKEAATSIVGINLQHPDGLKFFHNWTKSLNSNANLGVKWPNDAERLKESKDPRFLHHRQDQSTASLAAKGLNIQPENHFAFRHEGTHNLNDSVIFLHKGGYEGTSGKF